MTDRALVQQVLEALAAGDVAYATELLLSALEDGAPDRPYRCECGDCFQWPGELDRHRLYWHEDAEGRAA